MRRALKPRGVQPWGTFISGAGMAAHLPAP
jgi:phosphoribosylcarboxyaminoimidazole (NCAIR) mutase